MKIFYLGNNWLGWKVLEWLQSEGEDIVGLAVHPSSKQKFAPQILSVLEIDKTRLFKGDQLKKKSIHQKILSIQPDIAISILFDYIFSPPFISLFPEGIINLHPSYLPYNKGGYPNVWSLVEETPAGTTLHKIDEGIDTGAILTQKKVEKSYEDTGKSLYHKLERASLELFQETWPKIKNKKIKTRPQPQEEGSFHLKKDVARIDEIDLNKKYKAKDLINILRARTFPPYRGSYIKEGGQKIYLTLDLHRESCWESLPPERSALSTQEESQVFRISTIDLNSDSPEFELLKSNFIFSEGVKEGFQKKGDSSQKPVSPQGKWWKLEVEKTALGLIQIYNLREDHKRCSWKYHHGRDREKLEEAEFASYSFILPYVFEELGFQKLNREFLAFQWDLIQISKNFGFKEEAFFQNHFIWCGEYYHVSSLSILKEEWIKGKDYTKELLREKNIKVIFDERKSR